MGLLTKNRLLLLSLPKKFKTMSRAHQILGVKVSASTGEIKRAFRKKAHQLHPDVNKAPDAEERWMELYEAYELLLRHKQVRKAKPKRRAATQTRAKQPPLSKQEEREKARERARARAREHARMKFQAYKKTAYYQNELALEVIGDNFMFYSVLLLIFYLLYVSGKSEGNFTLFIAGFVAIGATPLWLRATKPNSNIRISLLLSSTHKILQSRVFSLLTLAGCNVLFYFLFAFNSFCSLYISAGGLLFSAALGYVLVKQNILFPHNAYSRSVAAYVVFPLCINLFFALNYTFATSAHIEQFDYRSQRVRISSTRGRSSYELSRFIQVPELTSYQGVRFFWSGKDKRGEGKVEYLIAEGLFGIQVVKSKELLLPKDY